MVEQDVESKDRKHTPHEDAEYYGSGVAFSGARLALSASQIEVGAGLDAALAQHTHVALGASGHAQR